MTQQSVIPIGKYKGRLVEEVLADDPEYLQWLAGQDWFRAKFANIYQVIINRGDQPAETPEHNALQVLFLDDAFCKAFLRCLWPDLKTRVCGHFQQQMCSLDRYLKDELEEAVREDPSRQPAIQKALTEIDGDWTRLDAALERAKYTYKFTRQFEERGIDVILEALLTLPGIPEYRGYYRCEECCASVWNIYRCQTSIEIKPSVGDDYPAVLRQMKANMSEVLLLRDYSGRGATREQFIATFKTAGKAVVFLADIEGAAP